MLDLLAHLERFRWFNPLPAPVREFLRADGDPGGEYNIIADHSATAQAYCYQAPEGRTTFLYGVIGVIYDGGTWTEVKYGAGSGLAAGYSLKVMRGTEVLHDVNGGVPIRTNADCSSHCDIVRPEGITLTTKVLHIIWDFESGGAPLVLQAGDRLELLAADDFDSLELHTFKVLGVSYQGEVDGRVQPPVATP